MLCNGAGLAELFGVSRSAVANWEARDTTFPAPLNLPGVVGIPIWESEDVRRWRERKH